MLYYSILSSNSIVCTTRTDTPALFRESSICILQPGQPVATTSALLRLMFSAFFVPMQPHPGHPYHPCHPCHSEQPPCPSEQPPCHSELVSESPDPSSFEILK